MRFANLILAHLLLAGNLACSFGQDNEALLASKPVFGPELSSELRQFEWAIGEWHVFFIDPPTRIGQERGWNVRFEEPITVEAKDSQKISIAYLVVFYHQQANIREEFQVSEFIDCDPLDSQSIRFYGITKHTTVDNGTNRESKKRFLNSLVKLRENEYSLAKQDAPCFLKNINGVRMARTLLFDSQFAFHIVCQKAPNSEQRSDITTD